MIELMSGSKKRYMNHVYSDQIHIMGIVNATPDSFSDGGLFYNKNKAVDHGLRLLDEGATILDIGGESTRPGAEVVDIKEEIERVVPIIKRLKGYAKHISIDTRNAETMRAALDAGATAVNDISGLSYDSESIDVIEQAQCPVFLMHSQGVPQNMQDNPQYYNVLVEVYDFLERQISMLKTRRIEKNKLIIDVGIGFGKTLEHNLLLLRNIKKFHDLEVPILLGTSRKSFIAAACEGEPVDERLGGSLSSAIWALSQGVTMFRVHDVKETVQAVQLYQAIVSSS